MLLTDVLQEALLLEVTNSNASERTIDLQPFADHGRRDEFGLGDLLEQPVVGGLVELDQIQELLLDLALAPLLLLRPATGHSGLQLRFLALLNRLRRPHSYLPEC